MLSCCKAQQPAPPSPSSDHGYPVTVEGHEVFQIYEAFGPVSAHERAEKVSERLGKLVYTPGADLAAITTNDSDYGTEIRLGDDVLTIVSEGDAERMHVARAALAKYYAGQIGKTVMQARQEHSGNSWFERRFTLWRRSSFTCWSCGLWYSGRAGS